MAYIDSFIQLLSSADWLDFKDFEQYFEKKTHFDYLYKQISIKMKPKTIKSNPKSNVAPSNVKAVKRK